VVFGLTRGEAVLSLVVFLLVYAGVLLPRLGEKLGVFWVGRLSKNTAIPPEGRDHHE
jgi:hypothetical protein